MNCNVCGTELEKGALICPGCGTVVTTESKKLLTKKEFWELSAMKTCRSNINAAAVVIYISTVFNGAMKVTGLIQYGAGVSWGELLLVAGIAVWMQTGKSRVAAVLLLLYGIVNTILMSIATGKIAGWWILLAGILAVVYTFQFQREWKRYQQEGVRPLEIANTSIFNNRI